MVSKGKWALGIGLAILAAVAVKKLWQAGAGVGGRIAFAAAPPATVVAGQSYSCSVIVTNESTLNGAPVAYQFSVKFIHYADGTAQKVLTNSIGAISANGSGEYSFTFTVPSGSVNGYITADLRTSDGTIVLAAAIRGDYMVTVAQVIPSGSVIWAP